MRLLRRAAAGAAGLLAVAGCATGVPGAAAPESGGTAAATTSCDWLPSSSPAAVDVGTPPEEVPAEGSATLLLSLGQGDLTVTLDRAAAPCAAASMAHLAEAGFFDGSPCHRLVDQPAFGVLQCGDPTGTGTGGPGYRFAEEVTAATAYSEGTVAMANSGSPGSTGSQFFVCFVDSELPPAYTAVGRLDPAGLAVVREIAAAGHDGAFEPSPGGGAPALPVTIGSARVQA